MAGLHDERNLSRRHNAGNLRYEVVEARGPSPASVKKVKSTGCKLAVHSHLPAQLNPIIPRQCRQINPIKTPPLSMMWREFFQGPSHWVFLPCEPPQMVGKTAIDTIWAAMKYPRMQVFSQFTSQP